MALGCTISLAKSFPRATDDRIQVNYSFSCCFPHKEVRVARYSGTRHCSTFRVLALDQKSRGGGDSRKTVVSNSNYVVPFDKSPSCITRPLAEILRDLNKKIGDNIVKPDSGMIPWYQANRMLSFHAPGWCGEVRDVVFSDNGSVTVIYRVTIRGSDGEAFRESTGTICSDNDIEDPVAAAEEIAFVRACARFGLGLYLYHDE